MQQLLSRLKQDFADITFDEGETFCWSPKDLRVTCRLSQDNVSIWSLLHEVGHAKLAHTTYSSDFELIKLEAAAWQEAEKLASYYGHKIEAEHIQDCLDTYRDWLHRRSTCPTCGTRSLQKDSESYQCFNCQCLWKVTASRFCRPYRKLAAETKKSPASRQATFA